MKYIDTHFHLDLSKNPTELAEEIEKSEVYTIAVTNTPSVFGFTHEITKNKKYIRAALGLHPELVYQRSSEIGLFKDNIGLTSYIGEIGLDFSNRNISSKESQTRLFETIIKLCADAGNKILTIHSRKAEQEVIDIIGRSFPGKVILHWYSGSLKNMDKALEFGFYFSINYQMTKSKNGLNIINTLPLGRVLTESDGPFVEIDGLASTPKSIEKTCLELDKIFKVSVGETQRLVYTNFFSLL